MLIRVVHILALGVRIFGKQVHCNLWSILKWIYLPPNLPESTTRKPEMVKEPTEGNLPSLEEMRHHELIDLVKKLLADKSK